MKPYIAPEYFHLLQIHQLHEFQQLWAYAVEWFETPNHRRGGWSGVARMVLENQGQSHPLFIKKQQNHGRWNLFPFPHQAPTFRREFEQLRFLEGKGFNVPKVVFYAEQNLNGEQCAILITRELTGYQPLDNLVESADWPNAQPQAKRRLLSAIATSLASFHRLHLMHRALYPKHIFVKEALHQPQVALIDFEKTRYSPFVWYNAFFDLAALHRHANGWRNTERLYFFKQYCQIERLTWLAKCLIRRLLARAKRNKTVLKQTQPSKK